MVRDKLKFPLSIDIYTSSTDIHPDGKRYYQIHVKYRNRPSFEVHRRYSEFEALYYHYLQLELLTEEDIKLPTFFDKVSFLGFTYQIRERFDLFEKLLNCLIKYDVPYLKAEYSDRIREFLGIAELERDYEQSRYNITVITPDETEHSIEVTPFVNLTSLREDIERVTGIPSKNQDLYFEGNPIAEDMILDEQGILSGSVITVKRTEGFLLNFYIMPTLTSFLTIRVLGTDTAEILKQKIFEAHGIPVENQRFIYVYTNELKRTLDDYNVSEGFGSMRLFLKQ